MNKWLITGVLAILTVTGFASEDKAEGVYFYPHINYASYDELVGINFDNDTGTGFAVGYELGTNWAWEASFDQVKPHTTSGIGASTYIWQFNTVYRYGIENGWRPIIIAGVGNIKEKLDIGYSADSTTLNLGAGVEYFLTESIALRGDVRAINHFDHNATDILTTVGFNFLLGKSTKPIDSDGDGVVDGKDMCPNTPTGNAVNDKGCELDGDSDGVVDSADQCPATPAGVAVNTKGCALDSDKDGVADYKDQCPNTPAGALVDENGCRKMLTENVEIKLNVTFDSNKAEVKPHFSEQIAKVAAFMVQYPDTKVVIEGYTDSMGAASYNQSLSEKRAKAVADSLMSLHNVDSSRVSFKGYGEANPVASNATREGRQLNRRVVAQISTTVTKPE
jgi:OOP family OmpA-OmpF porin